MGIDGHSDILGIMVEGRVHQNRVVDRLPQSILHEYISINFIFHDIATGIRHAEFQVDTFATFSYVGSTVCSKGIHIVRREHNQVKPRRTESVGFVPYG